MCVCVCVSGWSVADPPELFCTHRCGHTWDSGGFILFWISVKANPRWKESVRNAASSCSRLAGSFQTCWILFFICLKACFRRWSVRRRQFFYECCMRWAFFFFFKQGFFFLKHLTMQALSWRFGLLLGTLNGGMEKIIHRNVWGALKPRAPHEQPMGERGRAAG